MENIEEEIKMSFSEKRITSLQDKLNMLIEKIEENPPKTILGLALLKARIQRLDNIIKRKILVNDNKKLHNQKRFEEYDDYSEKQENLMNENADLLYEKEKILRELRKLERINPESEKSIFTEEQKTIRKNMPKGYKPTKDKFVINSTISARIQELEDKLVEIENAIEKNDEKIAENDIEYKGAMEQIKQSEKETLAVVRPNIFKRMFNFIKDKKEKFDKWRENKKEQLQDELSTKGETAKNSSTRKFMLSGEEYSQEAQAEFAKRIQERMAEEQAKTIEEPRKGLEIDGD